MTQGGIPMKLVIDAEQVEEPPGWGLVWR